MKGEKKREKGERDREGQKIEEGLGEKGERGIEFSALLITEDFLQSERNKTSMMMRSRSRTSSRYV